MKSVIIILAGTIALAGCSTMDRHQRGGNGYGSPPTDQGKPSGIPVVALPKGDVKAILSALKGGSEDVGNISTKDLAFIATFDKHGNIRLVTMSRKNSTKPTNVTRESNMGFPIKTKEIRGIKPFAIVTYKGSHCIVLVSPGEDNGMGTGEVMTCELDPPHPGDPDW